MKKTTTNVYPKISEEDAIKMILDEFPELSKEMNNEQGNFYYQIGSILGNFTQDAIDNGDKVKFKRICELFRKIFMNASSSVKNALYVSYLEDLNFQDGKKDRQWALAEMPKIMLEAYNEIMNYLENLFQKKIK